MQPENWQRGPNYASDLGPDERAQKTARRFVVSSFGVKRDEQLISGSRLRRRRFSSTAAGAARFVLSTRNAQAPRPKVSEEQQSAGDRWACICGGRAGVLWRLAALSSSSTWSLDRSAGTVPTAEGRRQLPRSEPKAHASASSSMMQRGGGLQLATLVSHRRRRGPLSTSSSHATRVRTGSNFTAAAIAATTSLPPPLFSIARQHFLPPLALSPPPSSNKCTSHVHPRAPSGTHASRGLL